MPRRDLPTTRGCVWVSDTKPMKWKNQTAREGANLERLAMRRKLRRDLKKYGHPIARMHMTRLLLWIAKRVKRCKERPGGL